MYAHVYMCIYVYMTPWELRPPHLGRLRPANSLNPNGLWLQTPRRGLASYISSSYLQTKELSHCTFFWGAQRSKVQRVWEAQTLKEQGYLGGARPPRNGLIYFNIYMYTHHIHSIYLVVYIHIHTSYKHPI